MGRFLATAGSFIDRIKINALTREVRDGRTIWVKRRHAAAGPIIKAANSFFRLVGNPVVVLGELEEWRHWEIDCFQRLHGDHFTVFADGKHAVCAEEFPGISLSRALDDGSLDQPMLAAAGRELRRAHAVRCSLFQSGWSHGDPHLGNFIYDTRSDRARLIDFEVRHRNGLDADSRHADDLLVLLQDLAGRTLGSDWLPSVRTFLESYGRPAIVSLLASRLVRPRGLSRLWWAVRTTYLTPRELGRRVDALAALSREVALDLKSGT